MWNQHFQRNKDTKLNPKDRDNWQDAAAKKLRQNRSDDAAVSYANHVTKAAINRRLKKNDRQNKKGPLFDGGS